MRERFPTPWRADAMGLHIECAGCEKGPAKILDVRGWGYLTGNGHGALGLSDDEAIAIQKEIAAGVVTAVNCHADLFEALQRAEQKLTAYVGVCKDDKELTGTILPLARAALRKAEAAR